MQAAGDAVLMSMDESYVHQRHHSAMSYVPTMPGKRRKVDNAVIRDARDGLRGCFAHGITKFGSMITHDNDGDVVRDCVWEGTAARRKHVPLNDQGKPFQEGDKDALTMEMFFVAGQHTGVMSTRAVTLLYIRITVKSEPIPHHHTRHPIVTAVKARVRRAITRPCAPPGSFSSSWTRARRRARRALPHPLPPCR